MEFPFYLVHQEVPLGPAGPVQIYYMHPGDLRGRDPEREISNFRSCIGYWYAGMQELGAADDWHQQRHYVMAVCYALVNRDKGPQTIYRDAFLRPDSVRLAELSLPDETRARITSIANNRDRGAIKTELDAALDACTLNRGDLLGYETAFGIWVDKGVNAFRHRGQDGIVDWLKEVDGWLHFYRKRCPRRVRGFINFFSFQAKVSFYLCFANFWSSLIPWLEEHYALDALSSRFLRIWHNQGRVVEIPHGRTAGGILYPTSAGAALRLPAAYRSIAPRAVVWQTEHIGPTHIPDAFSGHVLSLHPLGWLLLSDAALRTNVGRFIASSKFDHAMQRGDLDDFDEYWGFIDAVLTAAHLYRLARENYEGERHRPGLRRAPAGASRQERVAAMDAFMAPFVASLNLRCDCGNSFEYTRIGAEPRTGSTSRTVSIRARGCRCRSTITVTRQQIEEYLLGNREDQ